MTITILVFAIIAAALFARLFGIKRVGSFIGLLAIVALIYSISKDPVGTATSVQHIWAGFQSHASSLMQKLNVFFSSLNGKK